MAVVRLSIFRRKIPPFSFENLSFFSTATNPRFPNAFDSGSEGDESTVYRQKLLFQRPTTIRRHNRLCNSVSFVGRVLVPLKRVSCSRDFGVHTVLQVESSRGSPSFRILLKMWYRMAEISSEHLKLHDFIYVSGHLGSYTKVDASGKPQIFYEVIVKELNFVADRRKLQMTQEHDNNEANEGTNPPSSASNVKKKMDTLWLWQVFFSNPYEWWDNRERRKANPRHPDFKHKDTGECLWLSAEDPPWIRKQLQLLDSRRAELLEHSELANSQSYKSICKYVD
ncbi:hypothetical protein Scep_000468 [Stephania cephalantha]|uniref:Protein OSB1, mitochondrial n=1 Tax=Stephania cephalantha TaxID=152367 RepID=A0AAP0Q2H5_9MAGN